MIQKELTCIGCPKGCKIIVDLEENNVLKITGSTCKKGDEYVIKECLHPSRIVTSTVRVSNGSLPVVSVKTERDIPKEKIFQCMDELKKITISAPVNMGQVILENVVGTGVNIITTKEIRKL